ncbi:MAG: substrate-binding domain-containing protein [Paludibacteraceae bacterium]
MSQCSDDAWRMRMNEEMEQELIFHPELALHIRQAGDNSAVQCEQIDSFIAERVDLLIVSPNEAEEVKPAVSRAYDAGIPVIVADRQVSGEKWTAFIGGDNYAVGQLMAQWLLSIVPEGRPLRVLEIQGLPGSTPMVWRHRGMMDGLQGHPEVQIVASACGAWFRENARVVTDSLLSLYPQIDAIVAQNDQMAIGGYEACKNRMGGGKMPGAQASSPAIKSHSAPRLVRSNNGNYGNNGNNENNAIRIMGVDGIVGKGGGVEALLKGEIDMTATYPSRGDLVIQTAVKILSGEPYERIVRLPTVLIDRDAALPLQQIADEIDRQVAVANELESRFNRLWDTARAQRIALIFLVSFLLLLAVLAVVLFRVYRYSLRVKCEREESARIVAQQKKQLEDMTAALERTKTEQSVDERFVEQLQKTIERHLDDSEFNVEALSEELSMSRAQLFRKTKSLMGVSPVELIRHIRLRKAKQMLLNTDLTIQQVAYSVGFTSPSYFSKCYREFFGTTPTARGK